MEHELTIQSLHDARFDIINTLDASFHLLECTCGWSLVMTGSMTKVECKKAHEKHVYSDFRLEWMKNHSISNPPSFTSWKRNYKN